MRNSAIRVFNAHWARSLKRDGRDHSSSMKQPAVVPSALARGSQPAASPEGLWSRPSSDNDLALLAFIKYTYRTVSNALTYLQHSATSPRVSIFYFDKAWRFWSNWHIAEPQRHNRCLQQSGVYSLPQIETTMFIANRQRAGRVCQHVQPSFVHWCWRCRIVGYRIVYDLASIIVLSNTTYSASDRDTSGYSDIWDYWIVAGRTGVWVMCYYRAEMAWRLFIFWRIGYTYFSLTSQAFYDSCVILGWRLSGNLRYRR